MKPTVAIEIHGTIRHGCWSAERGESRWAQNLAALLGSRGREVVGFGPRFEHGWGTCPKVPHVELVDWSEKIQADALFDSARWEGKATPDVRHVLRGYFGMDANVTPNWPQNHHLVVPYTHLMPTMTDARVNPHAGNTALLPYVLLGSAFWKRYAPSAFPTVHEHQRKRILWGTKDAFGVGDGGEKVTIEWAKHALDMMVGWGLDGWRPTFLGRQALEPSWSTPAKEWDVLNTAEKAGQVFAYLPYGQVLQLMRESIVAITMPTWGSFSLECVNEGCVPIVWDTNPALMETARGLGLLIPSRPCNPAKLREVVELLLEDRELRDLALQLYQKDLEPYTEDRAFKCWERIEERWLT